MQHVTYCHYLVQEEVLISLRVSCWFYNQNKASRLNIDTEKSDCQKSKTWWMNMFPFKTQYSQNISDDPDRPAVHSFAVGLLSQNLRRWNNHIHLF